MERLTIRDQDGEAYWADARCAGGGYRMTNDKRDQARLDRLAAYEDTGLEPEEISAVAGLASTNCARAADGIDKLLADDTELASYRALGPIDHLRELVEAERDGRVVVLPCKVGDKVWVIRAYGMPFDKPKKATVTKFVLHDDEIVFLEALLFMDLGEGKKEYGYRTTSFDKIVFLSREEAEAALGGGGDVT